MKLKEYNRKNYPKNPLWKSLSFLRREIPLVLMAGLIGTGMAAAVLRSQPASAGEVSAPTRPPLSQDPLHDFHLVHGRLYGSRYKPISRVETDLPLTYETEGFNINLEWDGLHRNKLTATDRYGRYMGTRVVSLTPRADMDDDADVDEEDIRRFKESPFDIDLNGRIDSDDHRQFASWVGWRHPRR